MQQPHLFGLIRDDFAHLMNGYVQHTDVIDHLDKYIMPPQLGSRAGVLGSLILAEREFYRRSEGGVSQERASRGESASR